MNKKETAIKRNDTARKYDHNSKIHRNCVRFGRGESFEHAFAKFLLGYIVSHGGDIRAIYDNLWVNNITDEFVKHFKKYADGWLFKGSEREFLTEAITIDREEKHDIVILDSGEVIEIVGDSDPPRKSEVNVTRVRI